AKAIVYSSDDDSIQADNENDVHPCDNDVEGGDDNASTDDGVAEMVFDTGVIGEQHSVDPFELYGLLNKRKQAEEGEGRQEDVVSPVVNANVMNISQDVEEEVSCASVKIGGSVLGVLEEVIRVGQAIGFSMEGWIGVGCLGESYSYGSSNGVFYGRMKDHVTISDSFIAIYETWLPSNSKLLLVSIYAPQQAAYKRVLWEYMSILLGRWNGDAILIGDFNEMDSSKRDLIKELRDVDKDLDQGVVFDYLISKRHEVMRQLRDLKSREAAGFIQKSKVRWAIEGDENLKYFHGIINKKIICLMCLRLSVLGRYGVNGFENQFKYLGVQVGECMSRSKAWDGIILK
nr:RNA-directed DNA polymerase, eukaryota [Tanacetum cinerariifolium]